MLFVIIVMYIITIVLTYMYRVPVHGDRIYFIKIDPYLLALFVMDFECANLEKLGGREWLH